MLPVRIILFTVHKTIGAFGFWLSLYTALRLGDSGCCGDDNRSSDDGFTNLSILLVPHLPCCFNSKYHPPFRYAITGCGMVVKGCYVQIYMIMFIYLLISVYCNNFHGNKLLRTFLVCMLHLAQKSYNACIKF